MLVLLLTLTRSFHPHHYTNSSFTRNPNELSPVLSLIASFVGMIFAIITIILFYFCMKACCNNNPELIKAKQNDIPPIINNNIKNSNIPQNFVPPPSPPILISYPGNIQQPLIKQQQQQYQLQPIYSQYPNQPPQYPLQNVHYPGL